MSHDKIDDQWVGYGYTHGYKAIHVLYPCRVWVLLMGTKVSAYPAHAQWYQGVPMGKIVILFTFVTLIRAI
jgi:hypothetical protein